MKRLTEKDKEYYRIAEPYINWTNGVARVVKKLGQLEDIEEELGIEFTILSKILKKKKVWIIHEDILHKETKIVENEFELELFADMNGKLVCYLWFKDYATEIPLKFYGEHYALTKEELEKKV